MKLKNEANPLSRRTFVGGCGALSVLAGLFDPTRRRAMAAPAGPPLRLLIFGHLEGGLTSLWRPAGVDASFTLSEAMKPLEPWKSRLLLLDGFHHQTALNTSHGDTHGKALTGILTGKSNPVREENAPNHVAPSESIDQFLRDKINGPTRLPSIELDVLAACNVGTMPGTQISYPRGGGPSILPIGKPTVAFDRLFSGVTFGGGSTAPTEDPEAKRLRVLRASVLDHVVKDLTSLNRRMGVEDAKKVQGHLDAIRDLEKQISTPYTISCSQPQRPAADLSERDKTTIPATSKMMMDIIAQGLACDVTRMITFSLCNTGFQSGAPWLGETRDIHQISHGKFEPAAWGIIAPKIMNWMYQQQAYLMDRLSKIPEGDGTVLDHTLIFTTTEFGDDSGNHDYKNLQMMLAGSANGYLKTGRVVKGNGKPHNNVLVTIANALGVDLKTFGDPALCDGGPLASLRA